MSYMKKTLIIIGCSLLFILLIVPSVVAQFLSKEEGQAIMPEEKIELEIPQVQELPVSQVSVDVYRTQKQAVEKVPLEEYVRGVIASEMPADFEIEALKAQAIAARTYIVRRMIEKDFSDSPEGIVTDTVEHQVYRSEEELKELWGRDFDWKISRMNKAINETVGQVITFDGKPIDATFFSTSNGYTENSEDYWSQEIPYLRSVESKWDEQSPRFETSVTMPIEEFQNRLGIQLALPVSDSDQVAEVLSRTQGNRIGEIKIGDAVFTGREVRESLEIDSSDFTVDIQGNNVIITTRGYGHGVGMSQYGANGMAQDGYNADEIIQYYYYNVLIEDYREWIVQR